MFFGTTADVRSWREADIRGMFDLECPPLVAKQGRTGNRALIRIY